MRFGSPSVEGLTQLFGTDECVVRRGEQILESSEGDVRLRKEHTVDICGTIALKTIIGRIVNRDVALMRHPTEEN